MKEKEVQMDNILLGKVVKAMYKLSGKTLQQLSDETGLTVDTINNLFYARLQKPGYFGVESFVKATGFTMMQLSGFLDVARTLPDTADMTEALTEYMMQQEDTGHTAESTEPVRERSAEMTVSGTALETVLEPYRQMKEQYEQTLTELKKEYAERLGDMREECRRQRRMTAAVSVLCLIALVLVPLI